MKKTTSAGRPAPRRKAPTTVEDYFARLSEPARSMLKQIRATIRSVVPEAFKDDLKGFKTSRGTIQFRIDKPLPISLIKRIVKARVAEGEA